MSELSWTFSNSWNRSLENAEERTPRARVNVWATELGGSFIDRYLKMKGTKPTNPPNPRSLRKFEAGNMTEWTVKNVLIRAGLLLGKQKWVSYQYPNLLEVTGKLDFLAGGSVNWAQILERLKVMNDEDPLPDFFYRGLQAIIEDSAKAHPFEMKKIIIEVKSCSSFMFDVYERNGANPNHILQIYHYLKAMDMDEGHIVYVSKDDLRLLEIGVFNPSPVEDYYKQDIEKITYYIEKGIIPEKEKEILYDPFIKKFTHNWKVGYSNYLTMLYGYENQKQYEDIFKPKSEKWNRVLGRCLRGDKMTSGNLESISEIKVLYPNFDEIVEGLKKEQVVFEEEEGDGQYPNFNETK